MNDTLRLYGLNGVAASTKVLSLHRSIFTSSRTVHVWSRYNKRIGDEIICLENFRWPYYCRYLP